MVYDKAIYDLSLKTERLIVKNAESARKNLGGGTMNYQKPKIEILTLQQADILSLSQDKEDIWD